MKVLVVVDMQNDFITGPLGTLEAQAIVPNVINKIEECASNEDLVLFTKDTHDRDYLDSLEGKNLPVPHCIEGTDGWCIDKRVRSAWLNNEMLILDPEDYYDVKENNTIIKGGFGSADLANLIFDLLYREGCGVYQERKIEEIELVGVCTDICVIANAMILKSIFPNIPITVDSTCCAGVTPERHATALKAMEECQIIVK